MNTGTHVGMIIPDGTNQFFSGLAQGFQRQLLNHQCGLIVMNSDGSVATELEHIELLLTMKVRGLVFISVSYNFDAFDRLRSCGLPLLILDREIPTENADFVLVDNETGMKQCVRLLHRLGHRRVAYVSGTEGTEPGKVRRDAFEAECKSLQLALQKEHIYQGDFTFSSGWHAGKQIAKIPSEDRPTAVAAANDLMAVGVLQALHQAKIRVPEDISVTGFDDVPLASWTHPKLTTVRQDIHEITRAGAQLLVTRIEATDLDAKNHLPSNVRLISPELVERESAASAPA